MLTVYEACQNKENVKSQYVKIMGADEVTCLYEGDILNCPVCYLGMDVLHEVLVCEDRMVKVLFV